MIRLVCAPNIVMATLWADVLKQAGFSATVQRYFLGSIAGDLPAEQCLPEVWLLHDDEKDAATALLNAWRYRPQRLWHCVCGETVEGGFDQCWQCGADMPDKR